MTSTNRPDGIGERAHRLHERALVIDTLAGGPGVYTPQMLAELETIATIDSTADMFREIERLHTTAFRSHAYPDFWAAIDQAGVDVLSITIGAWGDVPFSFRGAVHDLGEWHRRLEREPRFALVRLPDDLQTIKDEGRTGVLLGFQNCTQLEGDLRNAETFHGLGVRMIQLTYNGPNDAGYGCTSPRDEGLTGFGRALIQCMNDLGLIVDLSHCGPRTTLEAINHSQSPVAVSHASCSTVYRHTRNKSDDVLRALADNDGFFGVCAVPAFLAPVDGRPALAHMIRHLAHAVETCGPHRVGIGTDWGVACSPEPVRQRLQEESRQRGFRSQDGFNFAARTVDFEQWAAGFPRITQRLVDAGFDDHTIEGVLGQNFERFYRRVHQVAG
ncbi:MAG: dipeptidase [Pseudonocardia sp.]